MRTPKAGETWIWRECSFHNQLRDVVVIGRDFEDQPPLIRQEILGHIYCGCQYPADDHEEAIRDLHAYEEMKKAEMLDKLGRIRNGNGSGKWLSACATVFWISVIVFVAVFVLLRLFGRS